MKGYFQRLITNNTALYLIYPVNEHGPIETLWANSDPKPVFLNNNNGWHTLAEIGVQPKILKEFKVRLTEWRHKEGSYYVEYPGAPKDYPELERRNFKY